ncbi:YIP1 family protein [Pyxidicoccus trucidator]|uniref:YIP1 family protein n=1 Tax=Pyxidicoccus trucidator TaxID=2709662 RepID=UPI0013D9F599|nr:YIP1 family protein [Pyxidicoccus trucidator]
MALSCPHCPAFVVPGAHSCGMCGASLLTEAVPGSGEAVCAVHPELRSLHSCSRCGSFACAQCLRQSERGELLCATCHARTPVGLVAWDRREELGTPRAFWDTCMDIILRPEATFERIQPSGTVGSSLGFAALCSFVGIFTTAFIYMGIMAVTPGASPAMEGDGVNPGAARAIGVGVFGTWIVMAPIVGLCSTLLVSGVDHLILRVAGNTEHPFAVTLRGNALSQAPYLLGLIPFCSMYVVPFWAIGLRVIAYRNLHGLSWGLAALGALAGPMLSCFVCGGGYLALILGMATLAGKS